MKSISTLLLVLLLFSCKEVSKDKSEIPETIKVAGAIVSFPEELQRVFEAHGGLEHWKKHRTLSYEMPKDGFVETHTIDLLSRKDKVVSPTYAMGNDGKEVWLFNPDDNYKGDPVFYHNLMFYFYAMPFVLADKGIVYDITDELEYDGISYPGIKISYDSGVGVSAKDNYYLHYDSETFEMRWLGYTVTYRSGEVSDNVKWIRYNDWQKINNVLLPKSITWYKYEGRVIQEPRSTVHFENVALQIESKENVFYAKPVSEFAD